VECQEGTGQGIVDVCKLVRAKFVYSREKKLHLILIRFKQQAQLICLFVYLSDMLVRLLVFAPGNDIAIYYGRVWIGWVIEIAKNSDDRMIERSCSKEWSRRHRHFRP
jgi:hypothetical protein